jgi:DNA repair protein RadA/Sms
MSKIQNIYVCSNCDAQAIKWSGRCLECGAWGSLKMQTVDAKDLNSKNAQIVPAELIDLSGLSSGSQTRLKTGISEFDRVLGGGLMPGSLVLLSGEPGIGKSTIVAQTALNFTGENLVYVSGEESGSQIKERFNRLSIKNNNIKLINEVNLEKILATLNQIKTDLVIIDSIQTIYSHEFPSEPGSLNQIRATVAKIMEFAKAKNISFILVGHITKDGQIAGPKSLEHIVDTVIYLESDAGNNYRILRTTKNRFGSVNEVGIFEMTDQGFVEVKNSSAIFLDQIADKISGSVISCIIEGSRPFLVEVQALVTKTVFGYPVRKASGFDLNRLQVLTAVISKRTKVNLINQDVILNIVGGLKINDPGLDLAICSSIITSLLNQTVDRKTIVLGEVGLGGEVRNIGRLEQRLNEAEKLGFTKAIIPNCEVKTGKIKLVKVGELGELVDIITINN